MCWSVGLSNVEYTTSAACTVRCQSVTSSGRSSTSSTITCVSGFEWMMPLAICLRIVVLPDFGGATIIPRCPLPIGDTMSTIRSAIASGPFSSRNRSFGNSGVSLSNCGRLDASSGSRSLTASTSNNAGYFSLFFGSRILPVTVSPLRSECLRTCDSDT